MPKNVIVQGITGTHGSFHTRAMVTAGAHIVAGTSPNKAGTLLDAIPVYKTIVAIQKDFSVDASVIFVPAAFARAAIFEAIDAEIRLIVCITEGIPVHDMLQINQHLAGKGSVLIGPNCPGTITPGFGKLGIIPVSYTHLDVYKRQNNACLWSERDAKSLAKALQKILSDTTLRNELSRKGKERASDFSWEKTAKKLATRLNEGGR